MTEFGLADVSCVGPGGNSWSDNQALQGELSGIHCVDHGEQDVAAERLGNYLGSRRLIEVNAAQVV